MFCKCLIHRRLATRSPALSLSYVLAPHSRPLTFPFPVPHSRLRKQLHLLLLACQAIERSVLCESVSPCGDDHTASYCICCEGGSSGCAAPEVCEVNASGQYGYSTSSVTIPGGTNTDIGTRADAGQADCGAGCMPAADTCCRDQSSYCPASEQC